MTLGLKTDRISLFPFSQSYATIHLLQDTLIELKNSFSN